MDSRKRSEEGKGIDMIDMPTLYLSDLLRRQGALRADVISRGDDTWMITFWFAGGRTHTCITARCRIQSLT